MVHGGQQVTVNTGIGIQQIDRFRKNLGSLVHSEPLRPRCGPAARARQSERPAAGLHAKRIRNAHRRGRCDLHFKSYSLLKMIDRIVIE